MTAAEMSRKTIILLVIFLCCCKAEDQQEKPIRNSSNRRLTSEKSATKLAPKVSSVTPLSYEYLQTPNFNCLLLPEEKRNAEWKKYASLFDPTRKYSKTNPTPKVFKIKPQHRRVQRSNTTQTFYGGGASARPSINSTTSLSLLGTSPTTSDPKLPPIVSINLERRIVETIFELLEKKNHIIVLQPRHCHADQSERSQRNNRNAMIIKDDRADFRNFAESLLQKLMHQLKNPKGKSIQPAQGNTQTVDPAVQRILDQLDREEVHLINKIYNDLADEKPKRLELNNGNCLHCRKRKRNAVESKSKQNALLSKNKGTDDCDKGYVFLVGSHNDNGKDLLMRAVRIVNKKVN